MRIAVTGGTGFVGSHLVDAVILAGHEVTALTRRTQADRAHVTWIEGSLENRPAMRQLVEEADAVIHVAGVLNALDDAGFEAGNVAGTLAMLAAATAAGVQRFVHVSSLAAREPQLSMYGASKARSEGLVEESGLDWAIVRPPAVYGPGDKETLELFKLARSGQILMPPKGRASYIHVDDLARLLLALAFDKAPSKVVIEPDDGRRDGWSHREFGQALGAAVGVPNARVVQTPEFLLRAGARIDRLFRGTEAKLTPDRVSYFVHPDWVADPHKAVPADFWHAQIGTEQGLKETARWYREHGWL